MDHSIITIPFRRILLAKFAHYASPSNPCPAYLSDTQPTTPLETHPSLANPIWIGRPRLGAVLHILVFRGGQMWPQTSRSAKVVPRQAGLAQFAGSISEPCRMIGRVCSSPTSSSPLSGHRFRNQRSQFTLSCRAFFSTVNLNPSNSVAVTPPERACCMRRARSRSLLGCKNRPAAAVIANKPRWKSLPRTLPRDLFGCFSYITSSQPKAA